MTPPRLKRFATLRPELWYSKTFINISQGSVATQFWCVGVFTDHFIAKMKEF